MDLGVSSPQIDNPARGFSFSPRRPAGHAHGHHARRKRGPVAGNADVQQIAEVIRDYGEERFAVQIAKAIVARRQERGPVSTTAELAELVAGAVKTREPGQDPATRTFQALRIFINAELEELQQALEASLACAATRRAPGGDQLPLAGRPHRQAVHRREFARGVGPPRPVCRAQAMKLRALDRIKPSAAEVAANPRRAARSCVWPKAHGMSGRRTARWGPWS
jgi:16S rRNA (cytosine1402-N4)-methyltransferase